MSKKYANLTNEEFITITTEQFENVLSYLQHTRKARKGHLIINGSTSVECVIKLANVEIFDDYDDDKIVLSVIANGVNIELQVNEVCYGNWGFSNDVHEFELHNGDNLSYLTIQG